MNLNQHPCFNPNACHSNGRIHLPVAPRCNIQCNFCNRKFDCVNESRPGVSSVILKPLQAVAFLDEAMSVHNNISVVGIAGPGDPFANPEETLTTLEMVREKYPDMLLCLASNGLNLPEYLDEIQRLNVTHVSITINAVDPSVAEKIYSWVRYGKKALPPKKGARILLEKQIEAVKGLKKRNILVKVNTIILPGINDGHVLEIAERMAELDVDLFNCMPYYPNKGANFSQMKEPPADKIRLIQEQAGKIIPQMRHCRRCRADAVGLLHEPQSKRLTEAMHACATLKEPVIEHSQEAAPGFVAVASKEGVLVNQHLGEAKKVAVYDIRSDTPELIGHRLLPEPGGGDRRWLMMARQLSDCSRILVSGAGERPKKILTAHGIDILMMDALVDDALNAIKHQKDISHLTCATPFKCDQTCEGAGMGCM